MAQSQMTGESPIIITHYINPTLFWFKYQSADCLPLHCYEQRLQSFANTIGSKGPHQPVRDEIVLVNYLTMQKWVRCKVEEITESSGVPEYTVWLIDYGHPLRTQAKWILPLPSPLAEFQIPLIFKGGLANILPAAMVFNMEKAESELITTENWAEYVVKTIEKILTDSDVVSFTPTFKIGTHFFGNVEVLTYAGKNIELRDVIRELSCGLLTENHQEFSRELKIGRTTNFGRFETQVSESAFAVRINRDNNMAALPTINSHAGKPFTQKVTEWQEQNLRDSVVNQKPNLHQVKDCTTVPEIAAAFDYSRSRQTFHFRPGDDDEPGLMGCAGSRERREMLEKGKQPDVVKTNPIQDYLMKLSNRSQVGNQPKPLKSEPRMVPAGYCLNLLHTVTKNTRSDDQSRNFENKRPIPHETNISNTMNYIHRSPKQFDRPAKREPQVSNVNTSVSSGNLAEVDWNQPQTSVHQISSNQRFNVLNNQNQRDSTSGSSNDEPRQRYSVNSRLTQHSARACPNQMYEKAAAQ